VLCAVGLIYAQAAYSRATAGRVLVACLEGALSLACALAAAGVVAGDDALELQAAGRRKVTWLAAVRLLALLTLTALAGALLCTLAAALRVHSPRGRLLELAVTVLAPSAFLAALAFAASVGVQGATPAAALVTGLWAAENVAYPLLSTGQAAHVFLFATTYTPYRTSWAENRVVLLALAAGLVAAGALALNRPGAVLTLVQGDAA
jgi:hypothetical protein